MSLIDKTYFQGEINLPGLQSPDVVDDLTVFIDKYETKYLQAALGYAFWKLFEAETAPSARWTAFTDGEDFTDCNGFLKNWPGLTPEDKISPIADYIYYWYTRDNITFTTPMGEAKGTSENVSNTSMIPKQVRAFNEMVDLTCLMHQYLLNAVNGDGSKKFPEFDMCQVNRIILEKLNFLNL